MKTALLAVVLVAMATAAPLENGVKPDVKPAAPVAQIVPLVREKRSSYGVYSPPCAAAQGPLLPHLAPAYGLPGLASHASYGYNPHAGYPAVGGYGAPHYRADDQMSEDGEMMSFSDMDHMTMARSYGYDAPAAAQFGGHVFGSSVASGPAVGVFPNAHVSGCNVPLLLSCSPSIVAGKIVSQPSYGASGYGSVSLVPAAAAPAGYRGADEHAAQEAAEEKHHDDHLQAHHEQRMTAQEAGHMPAMHS